MPKLINGIIKNMQFPETFEIPDLSEVNAIKPGDFVGIGIEDEVTGKGERFWTIVQNIPSAGFFEARVANDLVIFDLSPGEPISFGFANVLRIQKAEDAITI